MKGRIGLYLCSQPDQVATNVVPSVVYRSNVRSLTASSSVKFQFIVKHCHTGNSVDFSVHHCFILTYYTTN
jgi:hypothetical protein